MNVLITGAGGQLGQEWVHFCKTKNIPFSAFDSKSLDITNLEAVKKACKEVKPDVFINCAAYTKVDLAEDEKDIAERINAEAVLSISEICKELGIKLVHYSTDYVFAGSISDQEKVPDGYPEEFKTDPLNVYGATKRKGEEAILESGCKYLILRVSWLCGTYGSNFVKTMIGLGSEKDELSVVNDQFGSPTFADQVVMQSFELIKQKRVGIFHLSSEGITTWYEFAKEIFSLKGIEIKLTPVDSSEFKTKAKRPSFSKLSTQKISTISGIKLLTWQDGLKKLINTV